MTPLTPREIFDHVAAHLLAQGRPALRRTERHNFKQCAYRGDDGCRCAVGCLITDPNYGPELEGLGVESTKVKAALEASGVPCTTENVAVMARLQDLHDNVDPSRWRLVLDVERAARFGAVSA